MMRALTLFRPWPNAILRSTKRIENRTWAPPAKLLGAHIALHAGKRYEAPDTSDWPVGLDWKPPPARECPEGIVGVVQLVGFFRPNEGPATLMLGVYPGDVLRRVDVRWYAHGCYGWILDDVRAIDAVPCKGAMGLWTLPPDVEALVRERARLR